MNAILNFWMNWWIFYRKWKKIWRLKFPRSKGNVNFRVKTKGKHDCLLFPTKKMVSHCLFCVKKIFRHCFFKFSNDEHRFFYYFQNWIISQFQKFQIIFKYQKFQFQMISQQKRKKHKATKQMSFLLLLRSIFFVLAFNNTIFIEFLA